MLVGVDLFLDRRRYRIVGGNVANKLRILGQERCVDRPVVDVVEASHCLRGELAKAGFLVLKVEIAEAERPDEACVLTEQTEEILLAVVTLLVEQQTFTNTRPV